MPIRLTAVPEPSTAPVPGSRSGCQPNATVPATSDMSAKLVTATAE